MTDEQKRKKTASALAEVMADLSPLERRVLCKRFGIEEDSELTQEEIEKRLKLTSESTSETETELLRSLGIS